MSVLKLKAGKHSCVGHLSAGDSTGTDSRLEKPAMMVYCGTFDSMDGAVTVIEEHLDKLIASHNAKLDRFAKLNLNAEQIERMMPPLQLDHSTSSRDTIGRVVGRLFKGKHINSDGVEVPALYCERIVVLGKENVEPARDGRWVNTSIGADLEDGNLNEYSVTPFPAAPDSSLLSKPKEVSSTTYKGHLCTVIEKAGVFTSTVGKVQLTKSFTSVAEALEGITDYLVDNMSRLSEGEEMETKEQIKARHLAEKEALSLSHSDELKVHKLEEVKGKHEQQLQALQERHAEELKKLGVEPPVDKTPEQMAAEKVEADKLAAAAVESEKEMSRKLTAAKPKLITLAKGIRSGMATSRLAAREQMITAKVSRLRSSAKMTPAEQKKIDLSAMAQKTDAELESFFKGYEIRENVIDTRFHGTTKALSLSKLENLSKDARLARLEAEGRQDLGMPMTDDQKKEMASSSPVPGAPGENLAGGDDENMKHLAGLMGDSPSKDAVMAYVKKMMESKHLGEMAPEHAENTEKQMSGLVNDFNRLQTEFQDFIALVGDAAGIQDAELK